MSCFGKEFKVKTSVVVTYHGRNYVNPKGLASSLADSYALDLMDGISGRNNPDDIKKYGLPYLGKSYEKQYQKWVEHQRRIRANYYRRILPIITKLWK